MKKKDRRVLTNLALTVGGIAIVWRWMQDRPMAGYGAGIMLPPRGTSLRSKGERCPPIGLGTRGMFQSLEKRLSIAQRKRNKAKAGSKRRKCLDYQIQVLKYNLRSRAVGRAAANAELSGYGYGYGW